MPDSIYKKMDPPRRRVVPPGPDNPMGEYRIRMSKGDYSIHGTDTPWAIGRETTHGCIRLYPEDIGELYALVKPSMRGEMVYEPIKVGESERPHLRRGARRRVPPLPQPGERSPARRSCGAVSPTRVDPALLREAVRERRGVPVDVTRGHGLLTKASR